MAELSAAFNKFDAKKKSELNETIQELSTIRKTPLSTNDLKNREKVAKMYRRELYSILTRAKMHLGWDIGVLLASDNEFDWHYTGLMSNSGE